MMNRKGIQRALVPLVSSAVLLSACGGDDAGTSGADNDGASSVKPETASNATSTSSGAGKSNNQNWSDQERVVGAFSDPFAEPTLVVDGEVVETDQKCLTNEEGLRQCKPAAGTMALLNDGRVLYLNALEGTENVEVSIVAEFGEVSINDQSRVLSLDGEPGWEKPSPLRAGANPDGNDSETILNDTPLDGALDTADNTSKNDGALFCSDVIGLANGRVMAVGGTDYYSEPGIDGIPLGVAELEGIRNSRIFDPQSNEWKQSGAMNYGRWYPSMVTLPNSDVFVASGVTKLLKPVYPEDPLNSGRNVAQTETYDPCTGTWTENPSTADRSLPLYPRLHLLPNGHVLYNGGGQAFNPFGQGYDQALWNINATFNPDSQSWADLGYAGLPLRLDETGLGQLTSTLNVTNATAEQLGKLAGDLVSSPTGLLDQLSDVDLDVSQVRKVIAGGMRGSTSSTMLPLRPDENGEYDEVDILTAGGVPSYALLTNPGGYLPVAQSRIDTYQTDGNDVDYESRLTGSLNQPRWYGTNVLMPDGSVMVFSGGNRDGVVGPGLEGPIRTAERFDPETGQWTEMATGIKPRTYHNTALLLPDGRVLVGGHAPINTAYLSSINLESFGLSPNDGRDPSFEIYTPPYAMRDDRPEIRRAPEALTTGETFQITVSDPSVDEFLLMRRTVMTHLIDGDQRAVSLPVESRDGNVITLRMPDRHSVVPAGEYMLFASKPTGDGRVPSVAASMRVVNDNLECMGGQTADIGADSGGTEVL